MADLDWVKFFIPRFSFGTHDRHSRLNPIADLNSRGLHKHTVSRTLPESSKISHERLPFFMRKEKRILIDIVLHCGSLTEHVRNNQIVLYVENPRTLLFQFLVKHTRNEVTTLPCRLHKNALLLSSGILRPISQTSMSLPTPALTLLASRFQLLHVSWTMWT